MAYFIALVWIHFISDFLLQSDKMATNKSTSNYWLAIHCLTYSILFFLFGILVAPTLMAGIMFGVVTLFLHFITDWFTSRGTSYLWKKQERHWFFSLIGFDQAIHITTLVLTFHYLIGKF
jgi:membrane-bound metal-dependent hydrolase YbcI (DUF457 family)